MSGVRCEYLKILVTQPLLIHHPPGYGDDNDNDNDRDVTPGAWPGTLIIGQLTPLLSGLADGSLFNPSGASRLTPLTRVGPK